MLDPIRRIVRILGLVVLALAVLVAARRLLGGGGDMPVGIDEPVVPPEPTAAPATPRAAPASSERTVPPWVLPDADGCPLPHPVKAKQASGIYHVPGGASYERTTPDRCYASTTEAEADGFRPAKR